MGVYALHSSLDASRPQRFVVPQGSSVSNSRVTSVAQVDVEMVFGVLFLGGLGGCNKVMNHVRPFCSGYESEIWIVIGKRFPLNGG